MKKLSTISLIVGFIFLIGMSSVVFAADAATLKATPDKTTIKPGEELKVVLSLTNYDQENAPTITSISTKINFDTNIFEEITQNDISSDFLAVYKDGDENHELNVVSTSGIAENSEIATITFRAKSNITSTTSQITFKDNTIGENKISDTPITITIGAEEIPVETDATLTKIAITKKPAKQAYKIGEKFDSTGMEVTATYSDGKTKVVTSYTYQPMGELKEEDKKVTITYKEGDITKTAEQRIYVNEKGELPDTGINNYSIAMIAILGVMAISIIKLRKYNNA